MFFYTFIDPESIPEAEKHGEMGVGRLIDFLSTMSRDCIMVETDCWRTRSDLIANIKAVSSDLQMERKQLGDLIIHLWHSEPVMVVEGDDGISELGAFIAHNAVSSQVDFMLTPKTCPELEHTDCEARGLNTLHSTKFSQTRKNLLGGISFEDGQMEIHDLLDRYCSKLVRHGQSLRLVDYSLGEHLGDSQYQNFRLLMRWLNTALHAPHAATVTIQTTEKPAMVKSLQTLVEDVSNEVDFKLELQLKPKRTLPHRRYLVVDHKCLDIDRGVDLCHVDTKLCRELKLNYAKRPS